MLQMRIMERVGQRCSNIFQLLFSSTRTSELYSTNIENVPSFKVYQRKKKFSRNAYPLTCESLRPSFSASFLRSGLLIYFCIWNLFSSPRRWRSEKTALLIIPRRGFPRAFVAHGKTRPVPEKSPILPWMVPGNTAPPPGVPGWWLPVPELATVKRKHKRWYIDFIKFIAALLRCYSFISRTIHSRKKKWRR